MKKISTLFLILGLFIHVSAQKVEPTWESIKARPYPEWFNDAKLGIFIHWGLYSVPAFTGKEGYGEWYYRGLMLKDSARLAFQRKNYGEDFTYEDFDKLFKAELFQPEEWAELFKNSGAKYVLLVTKHHDGYCLWDCKYKPDFNSVVGGPKRNIVKDLTEAVRATGLKMGFYYSLAEWRNSIHTWYVDPPDSIGRYVKEYMIPQFKDLISTYKPSLVFTDGEWFNTAEQWHAKELISWYYNLVGDEAIVNDRWGHGADYGFKTPEYSSGIILTDRPWAECRGIGRSFALNRNEPLSNYLTSEELIRHFVKLVAAGGGMTLNVGPAADGQIPLLQQERLLDLGKWMELNGEAIYGSRPFQKIYEEKEITLKRVDPQINFDWKRNSPDKSISYDNFQAEWTGYLEAPETGNYIFQAEVDDYMSLELNGNIILSNFKSKSTESESNAEEANSTNVLEKKIFLKKGEKYPITIKYTEINLQAHIRLYWKPEKGARQIIPPSAFSLTKETSGNGLNAIYRCVQPYLAYTTKPNKLYAIALEFPDYQLELAIPKPDNKAKITLLGREGELPWTYNNGKLIIETKDIRFSEIKSKGAWVFSIDWP